MKDKKNKAAPKPKSPALMPPMKKAVKIETAPEPEIRDVNPPMPEEQIKKLAECFSEINRILGNYAVYLRPSDRRHLNGVGQPTLGFIVNAYQNAVENPELLPHHVPIEKFREDCFYFENFQSLIVANKQAREKLWNITLLAVNNAYADAREFYGIVRQSARSKIQTSKVIYNELFPFFKRGKREGSGPTRKELKSDVNALLSRKRDGEVIVRNVKPKIIKGSREVIDKSGE
jgi:hypothetical protein